jgi:hypothetical protein
VEPDINVTSLKTRISSMSFFIEDITMATSQDKIKKNIKKDKFHDDDNAINGQYGLEALYLNQGVNSTSKMSTLLTRARVLQERAKASCDAAMLERLAAASAAHDGVETNLQNRMNELGSAKTRMRGGPKKASKMLATFLDADMACIQDLNRGREQRDERKLLAVETLIEFCKLYVDNAKDAKVLLERKPVGENEHGDKYKKPTTTALGEFLRRVLVKNVLSHKLYNDLEGDLMKLRDGEHFKPTEVICSQIMSAGQKIEALVGEVNEAVACVTFENVSQYSDLIEQIAKDREALNEYLNEGEQQEHFEVLSTFDISILALKDLETISLLQNHFQDLCGNYEDSQDNYHQLNVSGDSLKRMCDKYIDAVEGSSSPEAVIEAVKEIKAYTEQRLEVIEKLHGYAQGSGPTM